MCDYKKICESYFKYLKLPDVYFEPEYNMCYCEDCHATRGDRASYPRGQPPKEYVIPVGWYRFAMKIAANMHARDVATKWHRVYHGTEAKAVKSIIEVGKIVPTGRTVVGGHTLRERKNHIQDSKAVRDLGINTKMTHLSPSIIYSGDDIYAAAESIKIGAKSYEAKVVFQVYVKPGSYEVKPETIGAEDKEIDPVYPNSKMEWITDMEGGHVLSGLLIQLTPK